MDAADLEDHQLAPIEVKGGRVSIQNGQWYQSDATGKHKVRTPFTQSQNAHHACAKWLAARMGTPATRWFPYLAAFPYTDVPDSWGMTGIPRGLILNGDGVANAAAEKIRAAIEREGQGSSGLAPAFLQRILPHLAGDFEQDSGPVLEAPELEDWQNRLTERQKILLDSTRSIPRARFVGGAGSGKTWLAVDKARRLAKDGGHPPSRVPRTAT